MRDKLLDSLTNHRALNYDIMLMTESPNVEIPQPYGLWDLCFSRLSCLCNVLSQSLHLNSSFLSLCFVFICLFKLSLLEKWLANSPKIKTWGDSECESFKCLSRSHFLLYFLLLFNNELGYPEGFHNHCFNFGFNFYSFWMYYFFWGLPFSKKWGRPTFSKKLRSSSIFKKLRSSSVFPGWSN